MSINTLHKGDDDDDDDDDNNNNNNNSIACLRQTHSLFQSWFYTQYDLVFPLSISDILSFSRPTSSCLRLFPRLSFIYILPCIFPPITSFRRQFIRKMRPSSLPFFVLCRLYLSSLTLCHLSSHQSN